MRRNSSFSTLLTAVAVFFIVTATGDVAMAQQTSLLAGVPAVEVRMLSLDIAVQADVDDAWRNATNGRLYNTFVTIPELIREVETDLNSDVNLYDVYHIFVPPSGYAELGLLADLTDYVSYPEFKWGDIAASSRQWCTYNKRVVAVPVDADPYVMYYRRDLIPDPPETWEEYIALAQKFHGQDLNGDGVPDYGTMLITDGGQFPLIAYAIAASVFKYRPSLREQFMYDMPDENTPMTSLFRTAGWEYVFNIIKQLYNVSQQWPLASGFGPTNAYATFRSGRAAIYVSFPSAGSWNVYPGAYMHGRMGTTRAPGTKLVFDRPTQSLVPCDPQRCAYMNARSINRPAMNMGAVIVIVNKKSRNFKAAMHYAAFLSTNVDVRKSGALNPFRASHWDPIPYTQLTPIPWMEVEAKMYTTALYESMTSPEAIMVPRLPSANEMNNAVEMHLKMWVRMDPYQNLTTGLPAILSSMEARIDADSAAKGFSRRFVEQALRREVGLPPSDADRVREVLPIWAIVVIAVGGVALLLAIVVAVRRATAMMHYPLDSSVPLAIGVVAPHSITGMLEAYGDDIMGPVLKEYNAIVVRAMRKHKCVEAQRLGDAFVMVAKTATRVASAASDIDRDMRATEWGRMLQAGVRVNDNQTTETPRTEGSSGRARLSQRSINSYRTARRNRRHVPTTLTVRVSLHAGTCIINREDESIGTHSSGGVVTYRGKNMEVAARLADAAMPGQTLATVSFVDTLELEDYKSYHTSPVTGPQAKIDQETCLQLNHADAPVFSASSPTDTKRDGGSNNGSKHADDDEGDAAAQGVDSVAAALDKAVCGMAQRRVTVLVMRLWGFETAQDHLSKDGAAEWARNWREAVEGVVEEERGAVVCFIGGHLTVSFNAKRPTFAQVRRGVSVALRIARLATDDPVVTRVTGGLACGSALTSEDEMLSIALRQATALELICGVKAPHVVPLVASSLIADELLSVAACQAYDIVQLPMKQPRRAIVYGIYGMHSDVVGANGAGEDGEWLYLLDAQNKKNPFSLVNKVFQQWLDGHVDEATATANQRATKPPEGTGGGDMTPRDSAGFDVVQRVLLDRAEGDPAHYVAKFGVAFASSYLSEPE